MSETTSHPGPRRRLPGVKAPFDKIVTEHGPTVLRVCRAVVGPVDAEDAWSETFLSALRAYPELDADANVEAWLVTIAHRKAIDVKRAEARRPRPVETVETVEDVHDATPRPGDPGRWDTDLWSALKALPAKQRQTVAYHHLAGFSHRQVAEIIGGSEAAARRASADGIAALRRALVPPADVPQKERQSR
ncbi:MAG: RNA polymerase sigma factor [Actinomycetes bacterium]